MFGGFASSAWNSSSYFIKDANAFLFSLRRGRVSYKDKFTVKNAVHALIENGSYRPIFGGNCDICIINQSNTTMGSNTNFGDSYNLPNGYIYDDGNSKGFLTGNFRQWTTTEIEIYQV